MFRIEKNNLDKNLEGIKKIFLICLETSWDVLFE